MMKMRLTKNLGMILLGIWLIMTGLTVLIPMLRSFHSSIQGLPLVMSLIAIVAGVLILFDR